MGVKNLFSTALYEEVFYDTDLEYIITPLGIKENIVVKAKKSNYSYDFILDCGVLAARLDNDGCIYVYNEETNEDLYVINAPYMKDAKNKTSGSVKLELSGEQGNYTVTVVADEEWINAEDTTLPVKIDPTLNKKLGKQEIVDATISSHSKHRYDPDINQWGEIYVARDYGSFYENARALVKFQLPKISVSDRVINAKLSYYQEDFSAEAPAVIEAYMINEAWNHTTVMWGIDGSNPAIKDEVIDYVVCEESTEMVKRTWDITKTVREWYSGVANNGIMFSMQKNLQQIMRNI